MWRRLVERGARWGARTTTAAAPPPPTRALSRQYRAIAVHGPLSPTWHGGRGRAPTAQVPCLLPPSVASQSRGMFIQTQTTPNPNRCVAAQCPGGSKRPGIPGRKDAVPRRPPPRGPYTRSIRSQPTIIARVAAVGKGGLTHRVVAAD
jgi:hypothetical protein